MSTAEREGAKTKTVSDAGLAALDRPTPAGVNAPGFGSDVVADDAARARHSLYRAQPRRQLPRPARQPGQLSRQRAAADAALPARGKRGRRSRMATPRSPASAMAVAVHSNVGLMHATMAIFNAWCDRMPMVVLGATGPVDAVKRRPWIDWIHTARDQGALVRDYTKWDDQPASPLRCARSDAARRLDRQHRAHGPDLRQSRRRHAGREARPRPRRRSTPRASCRGRQRGARRGLARGRRAAARRKTSADPCGRVSRDLDAWNARVKLAERAGRAVSSPT